MSQISGILLAAGQGTRFGSNKLLHPLQDGTPMVLQCARTLKAALPHSLVVVNARDSEVIELLEREGIDIVLNPSAEVGMGTSIARGVQASRRADGWVIALADMPWLQPATIRAVAAGLQRADSICAPQYNNRRGHPVAFGRAYAKALMQLGGDVGARQIIEDNAAQLLLLETDDRGVICDIDCPEDLTAATPQIGGAA